MPYKNEKFYSFNIQINNVKNVQELTFYIHLAFCLVYIDEMISQLQTKLTSRFVKSITSQIYQVWNIDPTARNEKQLCSLSNQQISPFSMVLLLLKIYLFKFNPAKRISFKLDSIYHTLVGPLD
jgi:hypothetical protein